MKGRAFGKDFILISVLFFSIACISSIQCNNEIARAIQLATQGKSFEASEKLLHVYFTDKSAFYAAESKFVGHVYEWVNSIERGWVNDIDKCLLKSDNNCVVQNLEKITQKSLNFLHLYRIIAQNNALQCINSSRYFLSSLKVSLSTGRLPDAFTSLMQSSLFFNHSAIRHNTPRYVMQVMVIAHENEGQLSKNLLWQKFFKEDDKEIVIADVLFRNQHLLWGKVMNCINVTTGYWHQVCFSFNSIR